jgi:hypothetical protein
MIRLGLSALSMAMHFPSALLGIDLKPESIPKCTRTRNSLYVKGFCKEHDPLSSGSRYSLSLGVTLFPYPGSLVLPYALGIRIETLLCRQLLLILTRRLQGPTSEHLTLDNLHRMHAAYHVFLIATRRARRISLDDTMRT